MNRFDQYVQQQFVPQFVPTPLDANLMMKALAAKQQSFDTVGAKISEFTPEVNAYTGDLNDAKQYINDTYEAEKIRIQEELSQSGDTSKAARELYGLNSRYNKDRQTGALYNFAARKAEDEANIAEIMKIKTAEDRALNLQRYMANRHTEFNANQYTRLNTLPLFEDPGMSSKVNTLIGMAASSSVPIEGGQLSINNKGEYVVSTTRPDGSVLQHTYKDPNEIAQLVAMALQNDPEAAYYMRSREEAGAPITESLQSYILSASALAGFDKFDLKGVSGGKGRKGSSGSESGYDGTLISAAGNHMSIGKMPWTGNYESTVASLDTKIANAKTTSEKRQLLLQKQELERKKQAFEESGNGKKLKANYETALANAEDKTIQMEPSLTQGIKQVFLNMGNPAGIIMGNPAGIINNLSMLSRETLNAFGIAGDVQKMSIEQIEKALSSPVKTVEEMTSRLDALKELESSNSYTPLGQFAGRYRASLENTFKSTYPELYNSYNAYNSAFSELVKDKDMLVDSTDVTISEKDRNEVMANIKPLLTGAVIDEGAVTIQRISADGKITDQSEVLDENPNNIQTILSNLGQYDLTNMVVSFNENLGQTLQFEVKKKGGGTKASSFKLEIAMDKLHEQVAQSSGLTSPNEYIREVLRSYEGGDDYVNKMETFDMLRAQDLLYAPGLDVSKELGLSDGTKVTYTEGKGIRLNDKDLTYDDLNRYRAEIMAQGGDASAVTEILNILNSETKGSINENSPVKLEELTALSKDRAASLLIGKALIEIAPVLDTSADLYSTTNNTTEKKSRTVNNPYVKFEDIGIRFDENSFTQSTPTIAKDVKENAVKLFNDFNTLIATGGTRTKEAHEAIYKELGKSAPKNSAHLSGKAIDVRLEGAEFLKTWGAKEFAKYGIKQILGPHNEPTIHSNHYHIQFI